MVNIIKVKDLTKTFDDSSHKVTALNKVSFELPYGESLAIIGSSGSGKTTMLHLLGGLDYPTSGKVVISGQNLDDLGDNALSRFRNKTIGFVFQFFHLQEYLTALENVAMPAIIAGTPEKVAKQKAMELLKEVDMEERISHYPKKLSGGEMQRVAVARALINEPKLILADEPTGNLDRANSDKVLEIFEKIGDKGISIVAITHDDAVAKRFKNIIKLDRGELKK